jgi:hypothetical protein
MIFAAAMNSAGRSGMQKRARTGTFLGYPCLAHLHPSLPRTPKVNGSMRFLRDPETIRRPFAEN